VRILGIAGSLRRESYNARLIRAAADLLPPGATLDPWDGLGTLPHFNEDVELEQLRAVAELRDALRSADGVLMATPEYNGSIPGALKNAVDWASRPPGDGALRGVPVAVIGASTGIFGAVWAQAELRKVLDHVGAQVIDRELPVPTAGEAFDDDGRLADPEQAAALADLIAELLEAARGRSTAPTGAGATSRPG
jgi:chromate reductase